MKDGRVRVGVIGTSFYSDVMHLPALASHPLAETVALCGRNQERARELARKYGIPATYVDYRRMIERERLDALVVAAPEDLHYEMAMAGLDAGLHVLCEKPLSHTVENARQMQAAAAAKHLISMTYFTCRWFPVYRCARSLIQEGFIGRPTQCSLRYAANYARSAEYSWRFDAARASGVLGELGVHMIDLARLFVGEISSVCGAVSSRFLHEGAAGGPLRSANDEASFLARFEGGATGLVQLSSVAHTGQHEQHVVLYGDQGTIEIDMLFGSTMEIRGARLDEPGLRPLAIPGDYWGGVPAGSNLFDSVLALYREQSIGTRLFVESVSRREPVKPDFDDGCRAQAVVDAVMRSSASGCWESPLA